MKISVSIPDDLFQDAERLAERLGKSRSQLYAEAVAEYIERHSSGVITQRLDAVLAGLDEGNQEGREHAVAEPLGSRLTRRFADFGLEEEEIPELRGQEPRAVDFEE